MQRVWETAMDWTGYAAVCTDATVGEGEGIEARDVTWRFLSSRSMSIAGGTTDVQLNIIGERLLGLPRDPQPTERS
jgi:alkylation response protein AidB-like acyl-CoA dehydrogenase